MQVQSGMRLTGVRRSLNFVSQSKERSTGTVSSVFALPSGLWTCLRRYVRHRSTAQTRLGLTDTDILLCSNV